MMSKNLAFDRENFKFFDINPENISKIPKDGTTYTAVNFKNFSDVIKKSDKLKDFFKKNNIQLVRFLECKNVGDEVFQAFKHLKDKLRYLSLENSEVKKDNVKPLKDISFTNDVCVFIPFGASELVEVLRKNKRFTLKFSETENQKSIRAKAISDSVDFHRLKMKRERELMEQRMKMNRLRDSSVVKKDYHYKSPSLPQIDDLDKSTSRKYAQRMQEEVANERELDRIRKMRNKNIDYDLSDSDSSSDDSTDESSDSSLEDIRKKQLHKSKHGFSSSDSESDDFYDSDSSKERFYNRNERSINVARDLRRK